MTVTITQSIPAEKFEAWHKILCQCGGRYLSTPIQIHNKVHVRFEIENYVEYNDAWKRLTTPINECMKNQWYRIMWRRIKAFLQFD